MTCSSLVSGRALPITSILVAAGTARWMFHALTSDALTLGLFESIGKLVAFALIVGIAARARSRAALGAAIAGNTVGLVAAFAWVPPALGAFGVGSCVSRAGLLMLVAVVVAGVQTLALHTLAQRSPPRWAAFVVGVGVAALHAAATWLVPAAHAVSPLPYLVACPPLATLSRAVGTHAALAVFVSWSVSLAIGRPRVVAFARAAALALVATLVLARGSSEDAPRGANSLEIVGIQGGRPAFAPRADALTALLAAEAAHARPGMLAVWPEGAFPYVPADRSASSPRGLDAPHDYARAVGMSTWTADGPRNRVLLQRSDGTAWTRAKAVLTPLAERDARAAPPDNPLSTDLEPLGTVGFPICYELLVDRLFASGPRLWVSVSSDGRDPSGALSWLLSNVARMRAIDTGAPVVRVSTGSFSAAFHRGGLTAGSLGLGPGTLRARVDLPAAVPKGHPLPEQLVVGALLCAVAGWRSGPRARGDAAARRRVTPARAARPAATPLGRRDRRSCYADAAPNGLAGWIASCSSSIVVSELHARFR